MTYTKTFSIQRVSADIDEARIVSWSVAPGTPFKVGDTLLEIETDKSVIEIAAEEDGILQTQLFAEGDVIAFDAPVAEIEVEGEPPKGHDVVAPAREGGGETDPERRPPHIDVAALAETGGAVQAVGESNTAGLDAGAGRLVATPAARSLAAQAGLELHPGMGTGPGGRITRSDVAMALDERGAPDTNLPGKLVPTRHGAIHLRVRSARQPGVAPLPTVVLLHGMFGDMDTWAATASTLSASGLDVVMLDLPGHGESPSNASTVDQVVEAVADILETTVTGPIALIGHSFGGAIAARVAGKLDKALHSLTLIAPVGLGTEIGQSFLSGMTNAHTEAAVARELRKLTESSTSVSAAYLRTLRARLANRQQVLAALCMDLARNGVQQIDILQDIAAIRRPVTLIHGRNDGIVPWAHALNAPSRTALHLIPGVGHMPQWEAPGLTAEIILSTLRRP